MALLSAFGPFIGSFMWPLFMWLFYVECGLRLWSSSCAVKAAEEHIRLCLLGRHHHPLCRSSRSCTPFATTRLGMRYEAPLGRFARTLLRQLVQRSCSNPGSEWTSQNGIRMHCDDRLLPDKARIISLVDSISGKCNKNIMRRGCHTFKKYSPN
jgi:hypothetical protein